MLPAIFFRPFSTLTQKSYLKKGRSKCPPNAKPLACGLAFTRPFGFHAIARESIFWLYKKQRRPYFLLSYRDERTIFIVIRERSHDEEDFLYVVLQEATATSVFFYVILQNSMRVKELREEKGRKIALCNDRRHYVVNRGYQSHRRRRINDDCSGNDRRPSYGASNRYRSECPARDGYCPRDNQFRERKSLAGRKKMATGVPWSWYIVSQEAMTTKVDCNEGCEIAPRNNQQNILHRIARTRATSRHCNTRLLIARKTTMIVSFMSCCERSNDNHIFDVASSGRIAREPATTVT